MSAAAPSEPAVVATPEPTAITSTPAPAIPAVQDWRASLPPEIQKLPSLEKFKDAGSLVRSYIELQTKLGAKGVLMPRRETPPTRLASTGS